MWVQILAGFVSALAFAYLYHVPRARLLQAGAVGGLGWVVFLMSKTHWSEIGGMFFGATVVAVCSELLARRCKQPVVLFLVPGVIPLVPGGKAYLTMLTFLQDDYGEGLQLLLSTVFLAGAVAAGIILASSIFRIFSRTKSIRGTMK